MSEITLLSIAEEAGVTVQTVLRHMGSREGCIGAVGRRVGERIAQQRGHIEPGDAAASLAELMAHYEDKVRLVLNLLGQEHSGDDAAARAVSDGRAFRRAWFSAASALCCPTQIDRQSMRGSRRRTSTSGSSVDSTSDDPQLPPWQSLPAWFTTHWRNHGHHPDLHLARRGHLYPMMDMALTLRARGHKMVNQSLPEERDSAVALAFPMPAAHSARCHRPNWFRS